MAGSGSQGKPVPGDKLSRKMHVSRVIASWFRPRAFISYSRQDADVAKRLYESVSSTGGCETFLDTEGTLTGEHFERVIVRQLRQADVVVAVISKASASSPWCLAELSYAHAFGTRVAPVQIGAEPVDLPQPLDWMQGSIHRLTAEDPAAISDVISRLGTDLAVARRRRRGKVLRGAFAAAALVGLVAAGWIATIRTLNTASKERARDHVVTEVRQSNRTLQRQTVQALAGDLKDDAPLLQQLHAIMSDPDRPDVERLNALLLINELTTARDPRNRWYIADVDWAGAELSAAQFANVTFQNGTISDVVFRRTNFAGVVWNRSPLDGAAGLMLSKVRFESSRFEGGDFAGTGGVDVQFVNSHFTGTRIALENLAATVFKSQSSDPQSAVITDEVAVFERVLVEHCAPRPAAGVIEIVPPGSEVTFDGVIFDGVHFNGWFRPEWFRNSHFRGCILPPELLQSLERYGNIVEESTVRSASC
jgi:uncharacterized protein YjbI with pentapeptide repeats